MQDRVEGFRCHHRIAAAKELIVHIVRDEAPEPAPAKGSVHPELVEEPVLSLPKEPAEGPAPNSTVVPAEAGTHPLKPGTAEEHTSSVHPEPVLSTVEGSQLETNSSKLETLSVRPPRRRRTRTQRRRDGAARAAVLSKERNKEEKQDKPTPVDLTPAERRIRERLEQHWHEPDPYGAPIESASPSRSPPG